MMCENVAGTEEFLQLIKPLQLLAAAWSIWTDNDEEYLKRQDELSSGGGKEASAGSRLHSEKDAVW